MRTAAAAMAHTSSIDVAIHSISQRLELGRKVVSFRWIDTYNISVHLESTADWEFAKWDARNFRRSHPHRKREQVSFGWKWNCSLDEIGGLCWTIHYSVRASSPVGNLFIHLVINHPTPTRESVLFLYSRFSTWWWWIAWCTPPFRDYQFLTGSPIISKLFINKAS